jgi:hypothetical protein
MTDAEIGAVIQMYSATTVVKDKFQTIEDNLARMNANSKADSIMKELEKRAAAMDQE